MTEEPRFRIAVFSTRALLSYLSSDINLNLGWQDASPAIDDVASIPSGDELYLIHREDKLNDPACVIHDLRTFESERIHPSHMREILERIHRVGTEATTPPLQVPRRWGPFHHDDLLAFYAFHSRDDSAKWIAQTSMAGSLRLISFWEIRLHDERLELEDFTPNLNERDRLASRCRDTRRLARDRFRNSAEPTNRIRVERSVALEQVSFGAVTRFRTYDDWLRLLTDSQKAFHDMAPTSSIKLRGAAGTGKTLSLTLKLLKELYAAQEKSNPLRVLFVTHSWAMASQIDDALRLLDTRGELEEVHVYPLLAIAESMLSGSPALTDLKILGSDSEEGKSIQQEYITDALRDFRATDWPFHRDKASPWLRELLESPQGTDEERALAWDLMNEFSSVLSANQIFPGPRASTLYDDIPRGPWMMPLEREDDRSVVLAIYTRFVNRLANEGEITTDQVITDFQNYLNWSAWNAVRPSRGYDMIFVDELHLFSEQERLTLHKLDSRKGSYPVVIMALDPGQAPRETFTAGAYTYTDSGKADDEIGITSPMDFSTAHRFSQPILDLVRHIQKEYPALGLDNEWSLELDAKAGNSVKESDELAKMPRLSVYASHDDEVAAVAALAREAQSDRANPGRLAILAFDSEYREKLTRRLEQCSVQFSSIDGRDDIADLRYSKRAIVVAHPEYVAGLQFKRVIVCGIDRHWMDSRFVHFQRRFLSMLYLALSRAEAELELHICAPGGNLPPVIESALTRGLLDESESSL